MVLPGKLEKEVEIFQSNLDIDVVYSNFYIQDESGSQKRLWLEKDTNPYEGNLFYEIFLRKFPFNSVFRFEMIKSEVFKRINYYDEEIAAYHDWDSRIRYSTFTQIGYSNFIGSVYETNDEGISRRMSSFKQHKEIEFIYLKNKHLISTINHHKKEEINEYWINYLVNEKADFYTSKIKKLKGVLSAFRAAILNTKNFYYNLRIIKRLILDKK